MDTDTESSPQGSVHDLPQLYTRPSSASLLSTLGRLKVQPAAWGDIAAASQLDEANLPRYLTSIIASSLAWIEEESVREEIWEAASSRLSERSGRTGMIWPLGPLQHIGTDFASNSINVSNIQHPYFDDILGVNHPA